MGTGSFYSRCDAYLHHVPGADGPACPGNQTCTRWPAAGLSPSACWRWFGRGHPQTSVACPWWQKLHQELLVDCLAASVTTELFQVVMVLEQEHCYFLYEECSAHVFLWQFYGFWSIYVFNPFLYVILNEWVIQSHSVISDSLQPHRLYSPWNSPSQNTGVGRISLL